jgi:predicted AAA+ superfamily ATPase
MQRIINQHLKNWKNDPQHKVLLIRGARQVGKTYSIREFGKTFSHFIEVNLDKDKPIHQFFSGSLRIATICEKLAGYYNQPILPEETLLFFDEIQECPDALRALRYFYEEMPQLHVVAAGSLLEFAIEEIPSFGTGRIASLRMYPLSFQEFVVALEGEKLIKRIIEADVDNPIDTVFHERFLELLRTYLLIGGMPAIVEQYRTHHDLRKCRNELGFLVESFRSDFAKYRMRLPAIRLEEALTAVVRQSGGKFMYSRIEADGQSQHYKQALSLLEKAGLVHRIYHSSARGIPLGAQADERKFKALLFDIGLHQQLLGLDISELLVADFETLINKGYLVELFAGLELIAGQSPLHKPQLYYWHRESPTANAEVDYVIQRGAAIVPLEVKSGTRGAMQSMRLFLTERNVAMGVRLSQENFKRADYFVTIPVYAAGRLSDRNSKLW